MVFPEKDCECAGHWHLKAEITRLYYLTYSLQDFHEKCTLEKKLGQILSCHRASKTNILQALQSDMEKCGPRVLRYIEAGAKKIILFMHLFSSNLP